MRRQLLLIVTSLIFASSTFADSLLAEDWYLGIVLVGSTSVDAEFTTYDIDREDNSVSFGGVAGHRLMSILSVEGGYVDLGSYSGSFDNNGTTVNESLDVTGWTAGLKLFTPHSWKWGLYARAGWMWWDNDSSLGNSEPSLAGDNDGQDVYFGAGVTRRYLDKGRIQIGAARYEVGDLTLDTTLIEFIAQY